MVLLGPAIYLCYQCWSPAAHSGPPGPSLDVRITCDGLQSKFQQAEYFTCGPLISSLTYSMIYIELWSPENGRDKAQHIATRGSRIREQTWSYYYSPMRILFLLNTFDIKQFCTPFLNVVPNLVSFCLMCVSLLQLLKRYSHYVLIMRHPGYHI